MYRLAEAVPRSIFMEMKILKGLSIPAFRRLAFLSVKAAGALCSLCAGNDLRDLLRDAGRSRAVVVETEFLNHLTRVVRRGLHGRAARRQLTGDRDIDTGIQDSRKVIGEDRDKDRLSGGGLQNRVGGF